MRIGKITANGYRTLEAIHLVFAQDYCTISGRNNAGKSCIIKLLRNLLQESVSNPWIGDENVFNYKEDKTQWVRDEEAIRVTYTLDIFKEDDSALVNFVEKISGKKWGAQKGQLDIEVESPPSGEIDLRMRVNGEATDTQATKEIAKKLRASNLLFLHNSGSHREMYYGFGKRMAMYEVFLSQDERKQFEDAEKSAQRKMKKLAREHREELIGLLGRLAEKYDVQFSPMERYLTRRVPLGINLADKNVEVPLNEWGSGTQNRTLVLLSILQANRIKTRELLDERITPIVVIEEPESFLHPSAQAEFGKILRVLSAELGIQIIVTTHCPYMLNIEEPAANILLERKYHNRRLLETRLVDTSGEQWMAPFAEHLGLSPSAFTPWRSVFVANTSKVLLVEGETDKEYFEYLREQRLGSDLLGAEIEIQAYGGKSTLTNTALFKFALNKIGSSYITFDLDAYNEVCPVLKKLGLKEKEDFCAIGLKSPGRQSIEGLLPKAVLDAVHGRETDLVMQLGSSKGDERRKAKEQLKKKCLEEFKKGSGYAPEDLKELSRIVRAINKKLTK